MSSLDPGYAERLSALQTPMWKRILDVQRPYRWNLRRLNPGRTLDVGCGIGRNLAALGVGSIGVDPNPACVAAARAGGHSATAPEDLTEGGFDSLLFAHVLEHVEDPAALVTAYLPRLRRGGQVILMTPQELGYASDATHVRFLDFDRLEALCSTLGLAVEKSYSFPLPRWAGNVFKYNEFVVVAKLG